MTEANTADATAQPVTVNATCTDVQQRRNVAPDGKSVNVSETNTFNIAAQNGIQGNLTLLVTDPTKLNRYDPNKTYRLQLPE